MPGRGTDALVGRDEIRKMTDKDDRMSQQLSAYLDGELTDAERQKVERSIEADVELAKELRRLRAVRELLGRLPRQQAGEQFVESVLARAERRNLTGPSAEADTPAHLRQVRWLATAAVVLITVGIAVVITAVLSPKTFFDSAREPGRPAPVGQIAREVGDMAEKRITPPTQELPGPASAGRDAARDIEVGKVEAFKETEATRELPAELPALAAPAAAPAPLEARALAAETPAGVAGDLKDEIKPAEPSARAAEPSIESKPAEPLAVVPAQQVKRPKLEVEVRDTAPEAARPPASLAAQALAQKVPVPAGPASAPVEEGPEDQAAAEAALADARREEIVTGNLDQTRQELESLLVSNGIVVLAQVPAERHVDRVSRQRAASFANYTQMKARSTGEVQYSVFATPSQMTAVTMELRNIQSRQGQGISPAPIEARAVRVPETMAWRLRPADGHVAPSQVAAAAEGPATQAAAAETMPAAAQPVASKPWLAVEFKDGQLHLKEPAEAKAPLAQTVAPPRQVQRHQLLADARQAEASPAAGAGGPNVQPLLITLRYRPPAEPTVEPEATRMAPSETMPSSGPSIMGR